MSGGENRVATLALALYVIVKKWNFVHLLIRVEL